MSTSPPGHLRPVPEGPWCSPALPGDSDCARGTGCGTAVPGVSRRCPRAPGATSGPGRLSPVPEGLRCRPTPLGNSGSGPRSRGRPAVPGNSGPCPMARWVAQVCRVPRALVGGAAVSTRHPGHLGLVPEGQRRRAAIPGDSGLGPRAGGVGRLSRGTHAWVRGPEFSTRYPGGLGNMPECQQCPQVGPGDTGPGPRARGVDLLSQATRVLDQGATVDQVLRVTRARARWPAASTSCPTRLGPWLEGSQCRPQVQDDSCSEPKAHEVDPMSLATGAQFQ